MVWHDCCYILRTNMSFTCVSVCPDVCFEPVVHGCAFTAWGAGQRVSHQSCFMRLTHTLILPLQICNGSLALRTILKWYLSIYIKQVIVRLSVRLWTAKPQGLMGFARWSELQASSWHEMCCHDLEVMRSNPGRVELGVRSTSVY